MADAVPAGPEIVAEIPKTAAERDWEARLVAVATGRLEAWGNQGQVSVFLMRSRVPHSHYAQLHQRLRDRTQDSRHHLHRLPQVHPNQ